MCVYSMVVDHFNPLIPHPDTLPWFTRPTTLPAPGITVTPPAQAATIEEIKTLLDAFRKSLEAAKVVDALTGQPDCEAAEADKAALLRRVEALEAAVAQLSPSKRARRRKPRKP